MPHDQTCRRTAPDAYAGADPPLRYLLPGRSIGLPSCSLALRTLLGGLLWLLPELLLARLCGLLGARRLLARLQRWTARKLLQHLRVRLELEGLQHVDPQQAYVVISLHEGLADGLALLQLPLRMRFVVRDELLQWRLIGAYLRDTGQIAIAPEQGWRSYRRLLRAARAALAQGESIVVFPQGSILGIEIACMPGAFALAQALQLPLLPIALTGSHRVWEHPYTPRLRYGQRMSMRILPPIPAEELQALTLAQLRDTVQQRLKDAALSGSMAQPRRFVPERDGYWDAYAYTIDPRFAALAAAIRRRRAGAPGAASPRRPVPTDAVVEN